MAHPNEVLLSAPAGLDAPWGQVLFTLSQWDEPVEASPTSQSNYSTSYLLPGIPALCHIAQSLTTENPIEG